MYLSSHSYYSLHYGTIPVDDLVDLLVKAGHRAAALTDINNTSAIFDYVSAAKKRGLRPVAGIDFRQNNKHLYTGIARNYKGFHELNQFLSGHNLNKIELPQRADELPNTYFIYPLNNAPANLRSNEFVGIKPNEVNKLYDSNLQQLLPKMVAFATASFRNSREFEIHRHLRAIDNNLLLSHLTPKMTAWKHDQVFSQDELLAIYENYPQLTDNATFILNNCEFEFDFTTIKNKRRFTESRQKDIFLLRMQVANGLVYRYGVNNPEARKRLQHELEIIVQLDFVAYFLITWDIIKYAKSQNIYHVGRGSGANSITAYCLGITDVDPIELDLYFERFINPERSNLPDFDIDFSWKDRDTIYEYIFQRYGSTHAALLGTISTFKDRSVVRELGKVYGLPKNELDQLAKTGRATQTDDNLVKRILYVADFLHGFPNMRSIHAGGVLISDLPISYYSAVDLPPKGLPTVQWDMYVAEAIRFEKLDILSQRGIGHILDCKELILKNKGIEIDVHNIQEFKKDPKIKELLRRGQTIGCFYVESPAMRGLLTKLRCDNYLSLVAASSIIRPGVAKSGMMRAYIERFHNPDGIEYLHPILKEQLSETFGIMVYQEDVLKVCHHFAGLNLANADVLRRAMSGKSRRREEFDRIVRTFFDNCAARGYPESLTNEVWRQIESFAGYSFSKAHSASYAVESYQSLYLRAHFPLEFIVAVINNFGGFYRRWVYFNEAKNLGGTVHLPCVNHSLYNTILYNSDIYVGFIHIQNLEQNLAQLIVKERFKNGNYTGLSDFLDRIDAGIEQIIILIRIGAFRFTGSTKQELLWQSHALRKSHKNRPAAAQNKLFPVTEKQYKMPALEQHWLDDAYDELEILGFTVSISHFDLLQTSFRGEIKARELLQHVGQKVRMVGHLVNIKYVRTSRGDIMNFGTFLDVEGQFFDTVHFAPTLRQYPFRGNGIYLILGKIVTDFDYPSLEVEKMAALPMKTAPKFL